MCKAKGRLPIRVRVEFQPHPQNGVAVVLEEQDNAAVKIQIDHRSLFLFDGDLKFISHRIIFKL
jgi:hypothetical protein